VRDGELGDGEGSGSDRANSCVWLQAQGTTDSRSRDCESQVIGNVWSIIMVGFLASRWAPKKTNGVARFLRGDSQTHSFSRARFA